MGRAEDLFAQTPGNNEAVIDAYMADGQSEELFLDFKTSATAPMDRRLSDNDRRNLAKAISGFGNSEGGIIVWGVRCRNDPVLGDVPDTKVPIRNPQRFKSWLEGVVSGCTVPAHPRVEHRTIVSDADPAEGFVVTYIGKSDLSPHQVVTKGEDQGHYFMRAGSSFVRMPHGVLAAFFGRRPETVLSPRLQRTQIGSDASLTYISFDLRFFLSNYGPGVARDVYVNLSLLPPSSHSTLDTRMSSEAQRNSHWVVSRTEGLMTDALQREDGFSISFMSRDAFRFPPGTALHLLDLNILLKPPFDGPLFYEISYGHREAQARKLVAMVEADTLHLHLQQWHDWRISVPSVTPEIRDVVSRQLLGLEGFPGRIHEINVLPSLLPP